MTIPLLNQLIQQIQALETKFDELMLSLMANQIPVKLTKAVSVEGAKVDAPNPQLQLSQAKFVDVYNEISVVLKAYAIPVDWTADSYQNPKRSPLILEPRANSNYWVIPALVNNQIIYWLVPNPLRAIRFYRLEHIGYLFDYPASDRVNKDSEFHLVQPGKVSYYFDAGVAKWKLEEVGKLMVTSGVVSKQDPIRLIEELQQQLLRQENTIQLHQLHIMANNQNQLNTFKEELKAELKQELSQKIDELFARFDKQEKRHQEIQNELEKLRDEFYKLKNKLEALEADNLDDPFAGLLSDLLGEATSDLLGENTGEVKGDNPKLDSTTAAVAAGDLSGSLYITLVSPHPTQAYAHWEIPVRLKRQLREQGGKQLVVRLYDITNVDPHLELPSTYQQFDCDELAWDLEIPIQDTDRRYLAEIGYTTNDGGWLMLARSAPL